MTSEIIECSCFNSRQQISGAEWITNLPKALTLNQGDSISVRQSILDANLSGEYTNIAIIEDIPIEIDFGYYYVNDDQELTYGRGDPLQSDPMGFYIARDLTKTGYPVLTNKKTFTIPKKNYSAQELAEFISAEVSKIPVFLSVEEYDIQPNLLFTPSQNSYKFACIEFSIPDGVNEFSTLTAFQTPMDPSLQAQYIVDTDIILNFTFNDTSKLEIDVKITAINYQTGQITFAPAYTYQIGGEIFITDITVSLKTPASIRFYNQNYNPNFANDYITCATSRYVGSNQFALEYNINGSGKFQFSIMHCPPYATDTDDEPAISVMQFSSNPDLYFQDTRTGIFFTNLQPANFWNNVLGFDVDSILVIDGPLNTYKLQTPLIRGINITSQYLGLDAIIGSTRKLATIPTSAYFYKTNITNAIVAPFTYTSQDAGYMLIEITAIPTQYSSEIKPLSGIVQIASSNWDGSGYITVYNDSSISFTNTNENPFIFGSFKVRILSPLDYKPVTLLGGKSTIFLELIKALA
jgi:hypothetical protein